MELNAELARRTAAISFSSWLENITKKFDIIKNLEILAFQPVNKNSVFAKNSKIIHKI